MIRECLASWNYGEVMRFGQYCLGFVLWDWVCWLLSYWEDRIVSSLILEHPTESLTDWATSSSGGSRDIVLT